MPKSTMLIETDKFLAVQLRYSTERLAAQIARTTHERVGIFYDAEGYATELVATDPALPEVKVAEGQFIYTDFTTTSVAQTADELLSVYERAYGAVEGDSALEKLVNIEFSEFEAQMDESGLPEWESVDLPYNQTRKDFMQRARHGMSDADWWNFETYFANVMIYMAKKFRDEGNGVPSDGRDSLDVSVTKWNDKLDTIIKGFTYYLEADDEHFRDYNSAPLDAAFNTLRDNYPHLWD